MTWRVRVLLGAIAASYAVAARAQSVSADSGNIFLTSASSESRTQLTRSGLDTQPSLSIDGKAVVFVRRTPGRTVKSAVGDVEVTEIRTMAADGSGERLRLRGRAGEPVLADFQNPAFALDGSRIYFESVAGATSPAVYALDFATGRARFLCLGAIAEVVPKGKYAGDLIVVQRREVSGGGSYDWALLIAPDGREVGPLEGVSDADLKLELGHAPRAR